MKESLVLRIVDEIRSQDIIMNIVLTQNHKRLTSTY